MSSREGGMKEIPIDWEKVDQLLISGCRGTEISAFLGIHHDTLYDRCKAKFGKLFSEYSAEKRQKGDSLLKHKQFQVAMQDNTSMLIWLGKQRLKQRENPQSDDDFNGKLAQLLDLLNKKEIIHIEQVKEKQIEETKVKQLEKDDGTNKFEHS